jgi:alkane 1-monooxygenase
MYERSSGIFIGIGIIYGHELSHTKGFGFVISRLMMALSGSAHFCYAHADGKYACVAM